MLRLSPVLFALLPFGAFAQTPDDKFTCRIIYVPTPQVVVDKMLDLVKVTKDDIVYDLGCGDGRIVCTAAKKHGAKGWIVKPFKEHLLLGAVNKFTQ